MTNKQFIYMFTSCIILIVVFFFTIYKIDQYLSLRKTEKELQQSLALIKSHEKATEILRARAALTELQTKDAEFKQAQALCMKDVNTVKPSSDHTFIYQVDYCRDRAIEFMGFRDTNYQKLKYLATTPLPSGIIVKGI